MKILLTGAHGQLGQELQKLREYITPTHKEFDITDAKQVERYLDKVKPDLIVHAAAYTKVQLPESSPYEAYECYKTNVIGTRNLAKLAHCPIIFISTETVLHPYNFYAITKLQAENEIRKASQYQILRTSFRNAPFEYSKAPVDMLTIADNVSVIAELIDKAVELGANNETVYVGTGLKTMYDLAKRTRPDVEPVRIKDLPFPLAHMSELLKI
jgi:dTDP-4-dehydrorhamnose reductase